MENSIEVPDDFICPITQSIMTDPVVSTKSGVTYDKSAVLESIKARQECPITKVAMAEQDIVPVRSLKNTIQLWQKNHEGKTFNSGKGSNRRCPVHGNMLDLYCMSCEKLICASCKVYGNCKKCDAAETEQACQIQRDRIGLLLRKQFIRNNELIEWIDLIEQSKTELGNALKLEARQLENKDEKITLMKSMQASGRRMSDLQKSAKHSLDDINIRIPEGLYCQFEWPSLPTLQIKMNKHVIFYLISSN